MIYLSVYLILHFLSSIYLLIQCGGKKKSDLDKGKGKIAPQSAQKPTEEKKVASAEKEKKDEAKQEPAKSEEKKSAEPAKEEKKEENKEEKKGEKKDENKEENVEKKEGGDKKQDEAKVDPTQQSIEDEKKQTSKQGELGTTKSTMGKPDEQIKISTSSLVWEDKEAQQVLKVTNNSEKKQALKIKCSNNEIFKVNPVFALIEASKTLDIVVTRKNGPLKPEKLLILTTPFDGSEAQKAYEDKELIPACAPIPLVPKS